MSHITTLIFDFSRVLLHTKDTSYAGKLNDLYKSESYRPTFRFFEFFVLDEELLSWIESKKGILTLALYTSEVIQNDGAILPRLQAVFGPHIFSAQTLGLSKRNSDDYISLAKKLEIEPSQALFVDDTIENVKAAQSSGMNAIQFFSREQCIDQISRKLSE